jgi:hypothetical protein
VRMLGSLPATQGVLVAVANLLAWIEEHGRLLRTGCMSPGRGRLATEGPGRGRRPASYA